MNKHQEAIQELTEFVHSELDGTRMLDKYIGYIETLKELVDETKTPTEEEIIKEWENEGFEIISWEKGKIEIYKQWIERINHCGHHTSAKVVIEKDLFYIVGQFSNKYIQLLTKTFKMLGWEV